MPNGCRGRRNDRGNAKTKERREPDYGPTLAAMSLAAKRSCVLVCLCDSSGGGNRLDRSSGSSGDRSTAFAVDLGLSAVTRDVAGLTAAVASLAGSVQWAAVRSRAVAGNVTKLAAGIALHGLSLAITGEVVGTTTLVASGRAALASETTTESSSVAAARSTSSTAHSWVGAVAGKVAGQTAAVAASAGASAAKAQSRAVSLDVSKTLAVVALLGF